MNRHAESFHTRSERLGKEAFEAGDFDSSYFFDAITSELSFGDLTESEIEANLILLLNRKLAPLE